jgi:hypothetical protein
MATAVSTTVSVLGTFRAGYDVTNIVCVSVVTANCFRVAECREVKR